MKKQFPAVIALLVMTALILAGCGKSAPQEDLGLGLGLTDWSLDARAWSSNNGATVTLTATPLSYVKGQTAALSVRLEGEEVENVACEWDGKAYTAEADLNAADGLCYYVLLSRDGGDSLEVEINTPANPSNEDIINMHTALEAFCHMAVTESSLAGNQLTITGGYAQIHLPVITRDGTAAVCEKAELVLRYNEEEVDRQSMTLGSDLEDMEVAGVTFTIPSLEDDEQLTLTLEVTLADGQVLSAPGCTWFSSGGQLIPAVG